MPLPLPLPLGSSVKPGRPETHIQGRRRARLNFETPGAEEGLREPSEAGLASRMGSPDGRGEP